MKKKWLEKNLASLANDSLSAEEKNLALDLLKQFPELSEKFTQLKQLENIGKSFNSLVPEASPYLSAKIMAEIKSLPRHNSKESEALASKFKKLFIVPFGAVGVVTTLVLVAIYINLPPEFLICTPGSNWLGRSEMAVDENSYKFSNVLHSMLFIGGGSLVSKGWEKKSYIVKAAALSLLVCLIVISAL